MIMSKKTYLIMKKLISDYENNKLKSEQDLPYIKKINIKTKLIYNPNYGDNRICKCGHTYYRHFDTYENMYPIGCKYCQCSEFEEDVVKKYNL